MRPEVKESYTKRYNEIYFKRSGELKNKPAEPEVIEASKLTQLGPGLDIGCGLGHNTIFLARVGFQMKAVDLSKTAIEHIKCCSAKEKLGIQADVASINEELLSDGYKIIVSCYLLDHFHWQDAYNIIDRMQKKTARGGVNVIVTFGKPDASSLQNECLAHLSLEKCLFTPQDLQQLYRSWTIICCKSTEHNSVNVRGGLPTTRFIAKKC